MGSGGWGWQRCLRSVVGQVQPFAHLGGENERAREADLGLERGQEGLAPRRRPHTVAWCESCFQLILARFLLAQQPIKARHLPSAERRKPVKQLNFPGFQCCSPCQR